MEVPLNLSLFLNTHKTEYHVLCFKEPYCLCTLEIRVMVYEYPSFSSEANKHHGQNPKKKKNTFDRR